MNRFSRRTFGLAAVFSLAGLLGPWHSFGQSQRLQTFKKNDLTIKTRTGLHKFRVEVARRPKQQAQGLMFRRRMAADAGMLFIYRTAEPASMWMKNTFIPLDLLYIDGNGKIVGFHQRAVPQSLEVITSKQPVRAVLEVNAGTAARLRIAVGDRILHPAFQAKK
jgi:uncharacterized membrane protein (UPF0127 family)